MYKQYIETLKLPTDEQEFAFILGQKRTCYNNIYPYKLFPEKGLQRIDFAPVTVFYGGNGSGKTTLLNVLAEKTGVQRNAPFNGSAFFADFVESCRLQAKFIPRNSRIMTSDDVFDYVLHIRYLNDGIDDRRDALLEEFVERKYSDRRLQSMADYEDWKESFDAKTKTQSRFVNERLRRNVDMFSNGENAMKYFVDNITENALYLLDEPENSLSLAFQMDLCTFLSDSARHFGCQFVIATHSPVLLSMKDARIYDLDSNPVQTKKWTELENVRRYFEFFESHRDEFIE